jgi:hypothetical protein
MDSQHDGKLSARGPSFLDCICELPLCLREKPVDFFATHGAAHRRRKLCLAIDPFVHASWAPGLDHDDSGTLNASWPKAMVDTPAWRAWNEAIEAAALKDAGIEQGPPPASWKEVLSVGTDIDVSVTMELVGEQLVTADISSYWDGHGAAHGNINEIQFNWLPKEQRELRPDDLFRRGTPWPETIESRCDADLRQQLGDEYDNNPPPGTIPDALKEIVLNPQNWRLDSDGLNVVFQQYAIACYACTPRPVSIPWTDLKPILNSAFEFHP